MLRRIKNILAVFVLLIIAIITLFSTCITVPAETYSGYVMGYFKQAIGEYGLNLCYSTDGLNWVNINDGKPVLYAQLGTKGIRDPYIYRKKDGTFVVLATDMLGTNWGDKNQYIHCWDSDDLITFKNERLLKVHSGNMHAWAPEVFYDYNRKIYGIYWSGDTNYNRTYVNYTSDFVTITENQVLFDPGYDVIDSDIIQHNGTAYLFFKDERSTGKSIKAAKSSTLDPNSFSVFTSEFITSANTEGPITFKDNNSNTWYMYADLFANNGNFECWKTTDLSSTKWTKVTNFSLPTGVRHGSVVGVTQTELAGIIAGKPIVTPTSTPNNTSNYILGDVNGSKTVDSIDFALFRSYLIGIIGTFPYEYGSKAADINGDGGINSLDFAMLRMALLGMIKLPDSSATPTSAPTPTPSATNGTTEPTFGATYRLVNKNSGKVLDVMNESTVDGAAIIQYEGTGGANQQWKFVDAGSGYKKVVSVKSGKVLGVSEGSKADGAQVIQWGDTGAADQQWTLVASGSYYKIVNRNSGKCLSVNGGSTANAANVVQWADNGSNDQLWQIVDVSVPGSEWKLVWSDEFNGTSIDTSNWGYELGYKRNNEQQYYTNRTENARIENGNLVIEARRENYNGYKYTSASLQTSGKKTWQYGRFELRAKIPTSTGSWPAWWTLGTSNGWPKCGEIDIMEFYKEMILANVAYQNPQGSIVWDSFTKKISNYSSNWSNEYHTWVMEWDENDIKLFVDNELLNTFSVSSANNGSYNPFRQPHYMLINLAIGGNNGGDPSNTTFPLKYYVDYVRVYQK